MVLLFAIVGADGARVAASVNCRGRNGIADVLAPDTAVVLSQDLDQVCYEVVGLQGFNL